MKKLLACLFVLVFTGFVYSDTYVYRDGYYWYGNKAYTRSWYQPPSYYYCGRYYYPQGYYYYYYSHTYQAPVQQVNYNDPGWRSKLLDLATARDKVEGKIRLGAFEQAYFMEAVKALGLEGNFKWQGYGLAPPYSYGPSYGNLQLGSYGAQGNTVYGYSMNSIASFYGDANLSQLYQQAARLAEGAQKYAGQATQDFGGLVGQEGQNRAKVAEILAKSQAVAEYLRAIQGSGGKIETKEFRFRVGPGADGGPPKVEKIENPNDPVPMAQPKDNVQVQQLWQAHAKAKCGACHDGAKAEGGFKLTSYGEMTVEQKLVVVGRLLTTDEGKRMPRIQGGGVAPKLSTDEIRLWLSY